MLIAAKYEEIYAPEVRDFVYITANAYSASDILKMESAILTKLDFNITFTTSWRCLERFAKLAGADTLVFMYARYLTEVALMDTRTAASERASLVACASVYLANKILQAQNSNPAAKKGCWSELMEKETGYSES